MWGVAETPGDWVVWGLFVLGAVALVAVPVLCVLGSGGPKGPPAPG